MSQFTKKSHFARKILKQVFRYKVNYFPPGEFSIGAPMPPLVNENAKTFSNIRERKEERENR